MSAESFFDNPIADHPDSLLYMNLRRLINGPYAEEPVDFNYEGLVAGEKVLGRSMTAADVIVDIGSSSGEMIADAAITANNPVQIICIEPSSETAMLYRHLSEEKQRRVAYVQANGECLPLATNSVQGATMHNVIFRAGSARAMLEEARRVVEPGGFLAISSNGRGHAHFRHMFEFLVAKKVQEIIDIQFPLPHPPADGHYLEDMPKLIKSVPGLKIVKNLYVSQETHTVITRGERLENYLDSIKFSAANVELPGRYRHQWRTIVDMWVKTFVDIEIETSEQALKVQGSDVEPFFADPINRGMFVLRNNKTK